MDSSFIRKGSSSAYLSGNTPVDWLKHLQVRSVAQSSEAESEMSEMKQVVDITYIQITLTFILTEAQDGSFLVCTCLA